MAQTLTDRDVDDPSQVGPLLDRIDGQVTRVTADGAYDGAPTYETIAAHGDDQRTGPDGLAGGQATADAR